MVRIGIGPSFVLAFKRRRYAHRVFYYLDLCYLRVIVQRRSPQQPKVDATPSS